MTIIVDIIHNMNSVISLSQQQENNNSKSCTRMNIAYVQIVRPY